jgi:nicotinamide-nucleotide amidase
MGSAVEQLSEKLRGIGLMIATAESCTGGMLAAAITALPGSSDIFDRGFVTYSNDAKEEMLDVPGDTLRQHGAVSSQTATAMVRGAIKHSRAEIAVAITGIAGPGGGSEDKPVGLVFIAYGAKDGAIQCGQCNFKGDRASIREQTVEASVKVLIKFLDTLA